MASPSMGTNTTYWVFVFNTQPHIALHRGDEKTIPRKQKFNQLSESKKNHLSPQE